MEYKNFRIIIKDNNRVQVIKTSGVDLEVDFQKDPLKIQAINIFNEWLAQGKVTTRDEFTLLGSLLYTILFNEEISREFKKEFDNIAGNPNTNLRLILEFKQEAAEFAQMPWEYIYYPAKERERGFFIGPHDKLILTRYVPMEDIDIPKPTEIPLRILVIISQPEGEDLGKVLAKPTIDAIKDLEDKSQGRIKVFVEEQPTKRKITDAIKNIDPHILHFIGHGKYENVGKLAFVGEDGKTPSWIDDVDLADCFEGKRPYLIFLQACEGAHSKSYKGFRGVALQLVSAKIPAVIAMQYPIENKVANRFALEFYKALSEGDPIDVAAQKGRGELARYLDEKNYSSRAFGSPVVYVPLKGEQIISTEPDTGRALPSEKPGIQKVQCPGCGASILSDSEYCENCNVKVMLCKNCLEISKKITLVKKESLYCRKCGKSTGADSQAAQRPPLPRVKPEATGKQSLGQSTSSSASFDDKKTEIDRKYFKPGEK